MDPSTSSNAEIDPENVPIALETALEWKIHDILNDGTERYIQPLTFTEHVQSLTYKVNWQKLVKEEANLDENADNESEKNDEDEVERPANRGAGPWDVVAQSLHQALIEINVLLDVLQIAKDGQYMKLDQVDATGPDTPIKQSPADPTTRPYAITIFQFKKRLMAHGQSAFEKLHKRLLDLRNTTQNSKEADFCKDLLDLRRYWRLKKVGNLILGDLSYRIYGTKFKPNSAFEVRKAMLANDSVDQSHPSCCIDIVLPKDLEKPTVLKIYIKRQDNTSHGSFFKSWLLERSENSRLSLVSGDADKKAFQIKLEMAQKTLLCKDIFAQLAKEAIHCPQVVSMVKKDYIAVSLLPTPHVLIIELVKEKEESISNFASFPVDPITSYDDSDFLLEQAAYEMYCADVASVVAPRIARPTSGSITLNAVAHRNQKAGADATPVAQLSIAYHCDKLILERLVDRCHHQILVSKCQKALSDLSKKSKDPVVAVQWLPESENGIWCLAKVAIYTPFYESCNRTSIIIEVGISTINTVSKDADDMDFGSNVDELVKHIHILIAQHFITASGILSRQLNWQMLQCSLSCVGFTSNATQPNLLLSNVEGTKYIFIKCAPSETPIVKVQNVLILDENKICCDEEQPPRRKSDFKNELLTRNAMWKYLKSDLKIMSSITPLINTPKGKPKTKGQKQIYEENKATMKFYQIMSLAGITFYSLLSYFVFYSTTTQSSWVCFGLTLISQAIAIYTMKYMCKTIRGENNQIIDAGLDLNLEGGFAEYCKDTIILTTGLQILSIISAYFWIILLAAPIFAAYKLWTGILAPWFFARSEDEENDDQKDKKSKKREKRIIYKNR
uniref:Transmembrane protein 208 n=1 Tax=Romanomermis culicivorax TaxID=13658 RepID=A0A915J6P7_ROMCU